MSKIRAHCRACHFSFYLREVVRATFLEGHCPNCGRPLAEDRPQLLREAARTVLLHDQLLAAVHALARLPGNLELVPHTLVRELLDEGNWADELMEDRDVLSLAVGELARLVEAWERLADEGDGGDGGDGPRSELRARLTQLRARLGSRAEQMEARHR
jgi:hypothetical protein